MPAITAAAVKDLRARTGAGMMDCKKALSENDGDLEAAVDWLRQKGLAAAQKKSSRVAAEGVIAVLSAGSQGAMIELNAETDFVARNDSFQKLARALVQSALDNKADIDAMEKTPVAGASGLSQAVVDHIALIGENIAFNRATWLDAGSGVVATYIHSPYETGLGRMGVMLALEWQATPGDQGKLAELGKRIAMHIVAAKPEYVSESEIPAELLERERTILAAQAAESGKPEQVIAKMVEGRMKRFVAEIVLEQQTFVIDNETLIADLVKQEAANVGGAFRPKAFKFFTLGENVEKAEQDFGAEVASMVQSHG